MTTSQFSRMTRWCLATIIIAFASPARPALAQAQRSCGCPDVYNLVNHLNMAEAGRAALDGEIPKIEAMDGASGSPSASLLDDKSAGGASNQDVLRGVVVEAMTDIQMRDARVPACLASPKTGLGFRAGSTTIDYVKNEIAGYESEIRRIRETLRTLPQSCRPHGWVGQIHLVELMKGSSTVVRDARILFRDASSRVDASIEETFPNHDTRTATWESDLNVRFSFDRQTGGYSLSFTFPAMSGNDESSRVDISGTIGPSSSEDVARGEDTVDLVSASGSAVIHWTLFRIP